MRTTNTRNPHFGHEYFGFRCIRFNKFDNEAMYVLVVNENRKYTVEIFNTLVRIRRMHHQGGKLIEIEEDKYEQYERAFDEMERIFNENKVRIQIGTGDIFGA